MSSKVQSKEVVILREALIDMLEYGFGYDQNMNNIQGYLVMGDEDHIFQTQQEAMIHALKTDEFFENVKDLSFDDKVIERYYGKSEDDCSLIPYTPYK